ncbi:Major Facilitator Superfamily protein [Phaeobacter inhibens]|uniref:MFS transporter n=1 Tax=Phaeobacter inhibens TaxID=221822 RepID=UPI000C9A906F|nr:MFS transporter [Phaeobacter inhibens]AUR02219.1 Major Facilitator Superfamily protein [Phaeobacter inhibens]
MGVANSIYKLITDAKAPDQQAADRVATHVTALTATKLADGLIDPKLVLAWLLNAIGAPGYLIGVLVPVRESGSLLPQLALAQRIEQSRQRKYYWAAGSALQGLAALGMAAAALLLPGYWAGWVILVCLALLAVARSACSASYKDILARTVDKGKRGSVSGTAGTLAASGVFLFAILLSTGILPRTTVAISLVVALAGVFWLGSAAIFARLDEPEAAPQEAEGFAPNELLRPLKEDRELRRYIGTRALLISTALAPPFLVMLGGRNAESGFGNLGLLVLASSVAAIVSSYIWGKLSDRSSRQTLMISGALSAVTLTMAAAVGWATGAPASVVVAGFVFVAQIAYQGARAGRKTHLTDMDTHGHTSVYTALSNTMIGVLLLLGGGLGLLSDAIGAAPVLAILAMLSGLGAALGTRLSEVQDETDD